MPAPRLRNKRSEFKTVAAGKIAGGAAASHAGANMSRLLANFARHRC